MAENFINIVEGGMGILDKDGDVFGLYTSNFLSCCIHIIEAESRVALIHDNGSPRCEDIQSKVANLGKLKKVNIIHFKTKISESKKYPDLQNIQKNNRDRANKIYMSNLVKSIFTRKSFVSIDINGILSFENDRNLCDDPIKWTDCDQMRYAINRINSRVGEAPIDLQFSEGEILKPQEFIKPKDEINSLLLSNFPDDVAFFSYVLQEWGNKLTFRQ
jgi:hypothetical protein